MRVWGGCPQWGFGGRAPDLPAPQILHRRLADFGKFVGPEWVGFGETQAASDAFGDDAQGESCESFTDAAAFVALAVVHAIGAGWAGAGFGGWFGAGFAGDGEVGAVSGQCGAEGHEPEKGAERAFGGGAGVARCGGGIGGGEFGVEGGGVGGEALDDGPDRGERVGAGWEGRGCHGTEYERWRGRMQGKNSRGRKY
jgi:hypothetical protein